MITKLLKDNAKGFIRFVARTEKSFVPKRIRKIIKFIIIYFVSYKNGTFIFIYDLERTKALDMINQIKDEKESLMDQVESYNLFMCVKRTAKIEGVIAEVGTYKGTSSKIICEAKGDREVYLFDTFEGLPEMSKIDQKEFFYEGQFNCSEKDVRDYLKQYKGVHIYKGIFPESSKPIENMRFSFVHLDVDIYKSALESIKFFYPRMNEGGVILSHDYFTNGIRKAFEDYFKDKPEPIIEMPIGQCLIVKTRGKDDKS